MNDADLQRLAARADLSRLLAACFYEPGPEFAEERLFESLARAAAAVDGGLAQQAHRLGPAFAEVDPADLLVDYTRLFLAPGNTLAQPYESVWAPARPEAGADPTPAVVHLYREAGLEIAEDFRDLPDHIAAELEFLYALLFRETGARAHGDADAARGAAALRQRLIANHLGRWIEPFAAAVEAGAQCTFYRALAGLSRLYVAFEARAAALD
ncbi:MAG: TorD/DmsD family molecular chaperone [Pseudomonadota bacterium]